MLLHLAWVQSLKPFFSIEIENCRERGGPVTIIASINDHELGESTAGMQEVEH